MSQKPETYFVSGHLDISPEEFKEHYVEALDTALASGAHFVVGDARGTDAMAQEYLKGKTTHVTVYHQQTFPRNNKGSFPVCGGFENDGARDEAMTLASDVDIVWVRSVDSQKKLYGPKYRKRTSGTEKNLKRRQKLSNKFYL
jgi:hypothetical protein